MNAIISLSGGLDSAVLLDHVLACGYKVKQAISFTYGSKHNQYENEAAKKLALIRGVPHMLMDLTAVFKDFKSSLLKTGGELPQGHYEEDSMRQTVVPFRNGIFLSILTGLAESLKADYVFIGAHAGDHFIYPDCRPEFLAAIGAAAFEGTGKSVRILHPFMNFDKAWIVKHGFEMGTKFGVTRTCYADQPTACGTCGSCQERLWAFDKNSIVDPLPYMNRKLLPKKTP